MINHQKHREMPPLAAVDLKAERFSASALRYVSALGTAAALGLGCDSSPLSSEHYFHGNYKPTMELLSHPASMDSLTPAFTIKVQDINGRDDIVGLRFTLKPFINSEQQIDIRDFDHYGAYGGEHEIEFHIPPRNTPLEFSAYAIDQAGDTSELSDSSGNVIGSHIIQTFQSVSAPGASGSTDLSGRVALARWDQTQDAVVRSTSGQPIAGAAVGTFGEYFEDGNDTLWIKASNGEYCEQRFYPRSLRMDSASFGSVPVEIEVEPFDGSPYRIYSIPNYVVTASPESWRVVTIREIFQALYNNRNYGKYDWLEFVNDSGDGLAVSIPGNFTEVITDHLSELQQAIIESLGGGDPDAIYYHRSFFWPAESPAVISQLVRDYSTMKGTVTDRDGIPVSNALVRLAGLNISARTDTLGRYMLLKIPAGVYDIEVEMTDEPVFIVPEVPITPPAAPPVEAIWRDISIGGG